MNIFVFISLFLFLSMVYLVYFLVYIIRKNNCPDCVNDCSKCENDKDWNKSQIKDLDTSIQSYLKNNNSKADPTCIKNFIKKQYNYSRWSSLNDTKYVIEEFEQQC